MIKLLIIITSILVLSSNGTATPKGSISGVVKDAKTDVTLPGVNIIIQGTVLGTSTDYKGNFELTNIPPGNYSIQFTMMGYESLTRGDVTIRTDENTNLTVELNEAVIETPELIVTASKRDQRIDDSPTSIALVTAKDIEQRNQIYLDQMLEQVPGVNFMGDQVNIRGCSGFSYGIGSRVLFLVDGVPVMSGDTGEIKWDFIPASLIKQVEIVKSAGSALYGSSALGGVINVITKEAALKPESNIRLSSGYYDDPPWKEWIWTDKLLWYSDIDLDHSRKIGDHSVFFSLGRHQSEGYRQNSEYLKYNASGKLLLKLNSQSNLSVSANWETGEEGIGVMWWNRSRALAVEPLAIGDEVHSNKFGLNAIHQWVVHKNLGIKNRVSWFRNQFENFMHDNRDRSTANRYGYELQGNYILSAIQTITLGTEETFDHVEFFPLGNYDIFTGSFYVQDELRILPNLPLTLGLRYDYTTTNSKMNEDQVSPKLGLVWHITDKIACRLSSGKGFRAPSISERFPNIYASGLKVIPNPGLTPETAWSHEIGISTPLNRHLLIDVAAFRNDYWDLIEPVPDLSNTVQFINLTQARISGVEAILRFAFLNRHLTGQIGHTYLDPMDVKLNETLAYRSKNMFNGSISVQYQNFDLGFDYRYFQKLEKVKLYPQDPRVAQKVLNVRLSREFGPWMFSINANNVFNHMHTQFERTILPVRSYTASLKMVLR